MLSSGATEIDIDTLKAHIRTAAANREPRSPRNRSIPAKSTNKDEARSSSGIRDLELGSPKFLFGGATVINQTPNRQIDTRIKLKYQLSTIPLLGTILNWTFKVFALPARFYALQQDFSNRAAWIDRNGDQLIFGNQQNLAKLKQLEQNIVNLTNQLEQSRATANALHTQTLQSLDVASQIQRQFEMRFSVLENHLQGLHSLIDNTLRQLDTRQESLLKTNFDLSDRIRQVEGFTNSQKKEISELREECNSVILKAITLIRISSGVSPINETELIGLIQKSFTSSSEKREFLLSLGSLTNKSKSDVANTINGISNSYSNGTHS